MTPAAEQDAPPAVITADAFLFKAAAAVFPPQETLLAALARRLETLPNVGKGSWKAGEEYELVDRAVLDEPQLLNLLAEASGIPAVREDDLPEIRRFPAMPRDFLMNYRLLPLAEDGETMIAALAHPKHAGAVAAAWMNAGRGSLRLVLLRRSFIERNLLKHYGEKEARGAGTAESEEALKNLAREAPIVRFVNDLFARAVEMGASDIHVEPGEENAEARFRIDGVLQTVDTPPMTMYPAIVSRLKLLSGMNIAERRLPQDGRIELKISREPLDVRVSTIPTMHGESVVLRLLQQDERVFDLERLGLPADVRQDLLQFIAQPHGLLLVVGPTGSGKTTTLYCLLNLLNSRDRKIITVEDPVEYQLPGLSQMQVNPKIGLSFANGLRSIVRQDPDVILVGEIRDKETADIAINAALTGHLVLSTLHTNDAAGAVARLFHMGVEEFLISSALLGVLSQRLVRRLCPDCAGTGRIAGQRCRPCSGLGYRGRVGVFELLKADNEIRQAVLARSDSKEIERIARTKGMRPLLEDAQEKVRRGMTSEAEIVRVCRSERKSD